MEKGSYPKRKSPAHHPTLDVSKRSNIVFLTVCSSKRKQIFDNENAHLLIQQSWAIESSWKVGRYVLLPDHIHLFCAPSILIAEPLTAWVKFWKSYVSRRWPVIGQHPIWQKGYWDRQLRTGESYSAKWNYVRNNPLRHGLVKDPNEWPYQGELNVFHWHDS